MKYTHSIRGMCFLVFFLCSSHDSTSTGRYNVRDIYSIILSEFGFSAEQFANYVCRRYCFINRLENTMSLFLDINREISRRTIAYEKMKAIFDFK